MNNRSYGLQHVYDKMRRACAESGGQSAWARSVGVSVSYVSDVFNARRDPGAKILTALRIEQEAPRYRDILEGDPA